MESYLSGVRKSFWGATFLSWQIFFIIFLLIYSLLATFFCIRFALVILKIQDAVENCLDKIDDRYASISSILERPLFFDSPEIRRVLEDVDGTRDSLLEIANQLSSDFNQDPLEDSNEG